MALSVDEQEVWCHGCGRLFVTDIPAQQTEGRLNNGVVMRAWVVPCGRHVLCPRCGHKHTPGVLLWIIDSGEG